MAKRIEVKPRTSRAQAEIDAPSQGPSPAPASDSETTFTILRRGRRKEVEPSSPSVTPEAVDSTPGDSRDISPDWEDQAAKLARQLTGSAHPAAEPVIAPRENHHNKKPYRFANKPNKDTPSEKSVPEGLTFKKKKTPSLEPPQEKKMPFFSFSLPGIQANLVSAALLFFAGNVLLALSMSGFTKPFCQLNPIGLVGICVAEGLFVISTFHSGEIFVIFSKLLVGSVTLFSALTAVGVFMAEAFLVPTLGFKLVENMPSAPTTASATFVLSACLVLNTRGGKTKWMAAFMCLLTAGGIQMLPVQHFVSAHISTFSLVF